VRWGCSPGQEVDREIHRDESIVVTRTIVVSGALRSITIGVRPATEREGVDPTPFTLTSHVRATGDNVC